MYVNEKIQITINGVDIEWDLKTGAMNFFGISSTLFWNDPSLLNMFKPLVDELGQDMFNLQVAHSSSLGTKEDYHAMVTQLGETFEEGFLNWGKAVSAAGWGLFELPEFDKETVHAKVVVHNPWELQMQKNLSAEERWGCPFLQGKIIGIFNHALKQTCWANQTFYFDEDVNKVEFTVYAHSETIEDKIQDLRDQKEKEKIIELRNAIYEANKEIQKSKEELVEQKNELLHQRGFLRTIIETIPDMMWLKDTQGMYLACNPRFEQFFGANEKEIVSKTDYDFVDKDLADFFRMHDKKAMQRNKPTVNEEWVTYADDGHKELLETTKTPMYDINGDLIGVLGIGHDITKQRLSEERLEYALHGSSDGLWDWNLETNALYLSPRWLKMLEYKVGDLPATLETFESLLHPDDKEATFKTLDDYIHERRSNYKVEFRLRHKDGRWIDILSRGKIPKDHDGNNIKPIRMVGTHVDITERKRFENKILNQTQELETIFDTSKDGIAVLDLESNFLKVNIAYELMTGFTKEELLKKSCVRMSIAEDIPRTQQAINEVFEKGSIENFEKSCYRKDGSIFTINMSVALMPDKEHLLITTKDVTHEVQLRHELVDSKDKAESATKAKADFLANMSHEIRTPMTGLLGFVERLKKGESDPEKIKQFETIENSGNTLLNIINDILDFSKIESGKLEIESAPIMMNQLLTNTPEMFQQLASTKNINLINMISNSIPECVLGDETRLKQVVFNLINNAIKFTDSGGTITLQARYEEEKQSLYIGVIDTGVGIAKENLEKIFDAFSQEDVSTTRKFGGTGLGLTISSRSLSDSLHQTISTETVKYK